MKYFLIALLSIPLILVGCSPSNTADYIDPSEVTYEITEDTDIIDSEAIEEAVEVIENNLDYVEEQNIEGYLSTIVSSAHENTRSELSSFFEQYDLEHTVLDVTVLEQEEDTMLIEVFQQSIALDVAEDAEEYRDHVAVANHTMITEEDEWKIAETVMTETFFLED